MFFWGGCEVPVPGDQAIGLGPGPGPCAAGFVHASIISCQVAAPDAERSWRSPERLKSFATPDSRRAATRLDASLRSAPLRASFHPDFIPDSRPIIQCSDPVSWLSAPVRYEITKGMRGPPIQADSFRFGFTRSEFRSLSKPRSFADLSDASREF